jgi:hypothetical protein
VPRLRQATSRRCLAGLGNSLGLVASKRRGRPAVPSSIGTGPPRRVDSGGGRLIHPGRDRSGRRASPRSDLHLCFRLCRHPGHCLCSRGTDAQTDPTGGTSGFGRGGSGKSGRPLDMDQPFYIRDGCSPADRGRASVSGSGWCHHNRWPPISVIDFCSGWRVHRARHPCRGIGRQHCTNLRRGRELLSHR